MDATCEDDELQSPAPPAITTACEDDMFSSAVGMCEDAEPQPAPPARPPLSCDGASCFPDDTPVPMLSPSFSYSQPLALAALAPPPILQPCGEVDAGDAALLPGHSRRIDRPPKL